MSKDIFCYTCKEKRKESYFKNVSSNRCPVCNSEDVDVYPHAEVFNRDIEMGYGFKEYYSTEIKCDKCGYSMMGCKIENKRSLLCKNNKCNNTQECKTKEILQSIYVI